MGSPSSPPISGCAADTVVLPLPALPQGSTLTRARCTSCRSRIAGQPALAVIGGAESRLTVKLPAGQPLCWVMHLSCAGRDVADLAAATLEAAQQAIRDGG